MEIVYFFEMKTHNLYILHNETSSDLQCVCQWRLMPNLILPSEHEGISGYISWNVGHEEDRTTSIWPKQSSQLFIAPLAHREGNCSARSWKSHPVQMKYAIARAITCPSENSSPTHVSVLSLTDTCHKTRIAAGAVFGQQLAFSFLLGTVQRPECLWVLNHCSKCLRNVHPLLLTSQKILASPSRKQAVLPHPVFLRGRRTNTHDIDKAHHLLHCRRMLRCFPTPWTTRELAKSRFTLTLGKIWTINKLMCGNGDKPLQRPKGAHTRKR